MYVRTELNVVDTHIHTEASARESKWSPPDTTKVREVPIIRGRGATATFAAAINSWVTFLISLTPPDIAYGSLFNRRAGLSGGLPPVRIHIHLVCARVAMNYIYLARKRNPECRIDSLPISARQLNVPLRKHSEISISRICIQKIGLESL